MKALDSIIAFAEDHPRLICFAGWGFALYLIGYIIGRSML